ncbi:MAG TPA: hypothetical protein PKV48_00680, partial [Thermodesulfobacteriota bacterium]|nr:hypothetical protein [Thermodesulfobacteriota bacterium]
MAKPVIKAKAQTIQEIRRLRQKAEEQLFTLPNVIGSMVGLKMKSGKLTKKIGLTIFVSQKVPSKQLGPGEQIPARVIVSGHAVATDVFEMRPLRPQAKVFPDHPLSISDGLQTGVVSSFCRSPYGVFGLTCAHVVGGPDKDPVTPDPVEIRSAPPNPRYIQVGKTLCAFVGSGCGIPGNFGFADAALFTLDHPDLLNRAQNAKVIKAAAPKLGEIVKGNVASQIIITGRVHGIEAKAYGMFIDVLVKVDEPGTSKGDSGMLWKNQKGQPVAIHAYAPED